MAKTAVVIDDSHFLVNRIVRFLTEDMGLDVVGTGADGNDAVRLYRAHKPDVLTLDVTMPNKDGQEALSEILEEFPDAKVVIVSAIRGDAVLECMSMGASGFVEKPVKFTNQQYMDDFRATIREALDG